MIELERTFLAKQVPTEIRGVTPTRLVDIYLPDTAPHPVLRLRQRGDHFEITKKTPLYGSDSSAQLEQTIMLSKEEFKALAGCSKKTVIKDRYNVKINGFDAEVDLFQDKLKGLILIDFEFKDTKDKDNFKLPDIALSDVTQDKFTAGGMLAGKSYEDIKSELDQKSYVKLDY